MPTLNIPIHRGDHSDLTPDWRDLLPVNMFFVPRPLLGTVGYLRSSYGFTQFGTAVGIDRGGIFSNRFNNHYRVSGQSFVSVDSQGTVLTIGDIPLEGQTILNDTFQNIAITNAETVYLYNETDGLRQIMSGVLGQVFDTTYINQRLIHTDGERLIVSNPGQDDVYDAGNTGSAETLPDGIVGVGRLFNKLLAFGSNGIEWFFDAGLQNFPFQRIEAQYIPIGLVGTHAKTLYVDNDGNPTYAFIGSGENEPCAVHLIGQANAPKISTREIDEILLTYTKEELSNAVLERRKYEHNDFLICHLDRHTLQYDKAASTATGEPMWTIQKTGITGQSPTRWVNGIFDNRINNWVYGDKLDGRLGLLDKNTSNQYGGIVEEVFYSPLIYLERLSVHELKLEDLPGRMDQGDDPRLFFSITEDDGVTYGQSELLDMGQKGEYSRNFYLRTLGYYDDSVGFRFRKVDENPMAIAKLQILVS